MDNIIPIITSTFVFGIWFGSYFNGLLPLIYVSSVLLVIFIVWQVYRRRPFIWALGGLFFVIGMLRFIQDDALPLTDISRYAEQIVSVDGIINEIPTLKVLEEDKNQVRYLLLIKSGNVGDGKKRMVTGILPVTVRQSNTMPIALQGDEIQVTGEVVLLHGYNNPAQYDSVAAAKRQGIRSRMSIEGHSVKILSKNNSASWKYTLAIWRDRMIKSMQKVMPESHAAILAGMLFGGYGGIPHDIVADFATTGIVHILSVSGSHIALVVGVVTAIGTSVVRRFTLPMILIPLVAATIVTFYAVLCGLTPPVLRSLIMGLIALLAVCFERENDAKNSLLLSALGMIVYEPTLIFDLSFQLSFASTAGLVFLNGKLVKMMASLPLGLAKALAVTIAAQLGVLPFIAWYFNSFSLSSFVANLLIVPLIEGIVILGLFGAVAGLMMGILGNIIMVICSLLINVVIQCSAWLAAVPGAKVYIPPIGISGGLVYYALLAWVYGYKPKNMVSLTELIQKWPRQSAIFAFVVVILIIVDKIYPRPMYVHFIDVGQGDATLITTPHGRTILVDTGGVVGNTNDFDIGDRVVVPYLKHYGVLAIDYLFLTHGHQDHAGGAAAVARELTVRNSMLARETHTQPVRNLINEGKKQGSTFIAVYEGQRIDLDGVVIRVIHAANSMHIGQNNEVSSVIQICYGKQSFLLTGDLEGQGEEDILASGKNIKSTVLKVGHHGSKTSSTIDFVKAVAPEYAVISVGKNNRFGHPHRDTIQRFFVQKSQVYRTDQQGAIVFKTDGEKIEVNTFIHD
ncbi:DNA internalization-related competence protein ComEC/Rec2 [Pelosinus sp. sgz500959]|uniref:DNA internalization-related competence protein ComEC/Rec2 n=1 Tax=Pelosinus sp. sgz500959 TaxID=3242472 RepID=UPI00366B2D13